MSPLTFTQTLGLIFVLRWITPKTAKSKNANNLWNKDKFWNKAAKAIPKSILYHAGTLAIGYLIHFFI